MPFKWVVFLNYRTIQHGIQCDFGKTVNKENKVEKNK
jgi:hypothetical protein